MQPDATADSEANPESNMPDIPTLTKQVQELAQAHGFWTNFSIVFVALTAIAAVLYFVGQWKTIQRGKDLNNVQSELIRAKDEELARNLKDKDLEVKRIETEGRENVAKVKAGADEKIAGLTLEAERAQAERAEANKQIANAEARAQEAQARAVEATAEVSRFRITIASAETKRLEAERRLLEIQKTIPRRLTPEQYLALVEALKPFAGHHVMVSPIRATQRMPYPEIEGIGGQIMDALREAGWKYSEGGWTAESLSDKGIHNLSPGITPLFFGSETPSEPFQTLVRELRKADLYVLNIARGPFEGDRHFADEFSEVLIIGEKP